MEETSGFKLQAIAPRLEGNVLFVDWIDNFQLYYAVFPRTVAAFNMPLDMELEDYNATNIKNNTEARLVLQQSIDSERWSLIKHEARVVNALELLRQVC
jgi:hypothetical protein